METNHTDKQVFLTTYNWEGAFVLRELLQAGVSIDCVLAQDIWWKKKTFGGYSIRYWLKLLLDKTLGLFGRRYYTLNGICNSYGVRMIAIKNINKEVDLLLRLDPKVLIVVGSRVLEPKIVKAFEGKILNFHTGILPQYRGPYSEFWAMYNGEHENVGTTIHLIDLGIDTGKILAQKKVNETFNTPEEAHVMNVRLGAKLLAKCTEDYLTSRIKAVDQDINEAKYYSTPTNKEFKSLTKKIGKRFNIDFAE